MQRIQSPGIVTFVALAILSGAATAQVSTPDGAVALEDCWHTRGGSLARSGVTATQTVRGAVEERWTQSFEGEIEGEPVVWRDRVFVPERRDAKTRFLHVLDRDNGAPRCKPMKVRSTVSLEPAVWGDSVVYRSGERSLAVCRIARSRLIPLDTANRWVFKGPVTAPLIIGREVYAAAGRSAQRFTVGSVAPVWSVTVNALGPVSLHGDAVYVAADVGDDSLGLLALNRSDGRVANKRSLEIPASVVSSAGVQIGPGDWTLNVDKYRLSELPKDIGELPNTFLWSRSKAAGAHAKTAQQLVTLSPLSWAEDKWIATVKSESGALWACEQDKGVIVLANADNHPRCLERPLPTSVARNTGMLGGVAFDIESRRILWDTRTPSVTRSIPVRGGVLIQPNPRSLALWGSSAAAATSPARWNHASIADKPGVALGSAVAVLSDGNCVEGSLSVDLTADALRVAGTKTPAAQWSDVAWLFSKDNATLACSADIDVEVLCAGLAEQMRGKQLAKLINPARLTKDVDLYERVVLLAESAGIPAVRMKAARSQLAKMQKGRKRYRPIAKKVAAVEKKLATLDSTIAELPWTIYAGLDADVPFRIRHAFLLRLAQDGLHRADVDAEIRKLLPPGAPTAEPFDQLQWLEFARAHRDVAFEFVQPGDRLDTSLPVEDRELSRLRQEWGGKGRDDLIAVRSKQLFVVGSVKSPGSIARCVSAGELICETLDKLFRRDGESERINAGRLKIILFDSKDEYLALPDRGAPDPRSKGGGSHLGWTAGHYSPSENNGDGLSRMFVQPDDVGFSRIMDVFAHELTHHWIDQRCPRFTLAQRRDALAVPKGYWIVEGFAKLIENATFDLEARSVSFESPVHEDLAVLTDKRANQGMPWATLFSLRQHIAQTRLETEPGSAGFVMNRYQLGTRREASQMSFYYTMSSAACAYLFHAEDGRYRNQLVNYVVDYYTARPETEDKLDVEKAFGVGPRALGLAIQKFAKRVADEGVW